jgi:hypothetical protein
LAATRPFSPSGLWDRLVGGRIGHLRSSTTHSILFYGIRGIGIASVASSRHLELWIGHPLAHPLWSHHLASTLDVGVFTALQHALMLYRPTVVLRLMPCDQGWTPLLLSSLWLAEGLWSTDPALCIFDLYLKIPHIPIARIQKPRAAFPFLSTIKHLVCGLRWKRWALSPLLQWFVRRGVRQGVIFRAEASLPNELGREM